MVYLYLPCTKPFSSIYINFSFKSLLQPYEVDTIIPDFMYRETEKQEEQLTCQLTHDLGPGIVAPGLTLFTTYCECVCAV